jgi:hypothetical protein
VIRASEADALGRGKESVVTAVEGITRGGVGGSTPAETESMRGVLNLDN